MAEQLASSLLAFRHIVVVPCVPLKLLNCVILLSIISPVPFGARVKFSLVPVVISVTTPEKVSVPVVVIAPDEIVPMLVKLPEESILVVLFV